MGVPAPPPPLPSTPPVSPDVPLRCFNLGLAAPRAAPAAVPETAPNWSAAAPAPSPAGPPAWDGPPPAAAAPPGGADTTASPGRFKPVSSTHSSHFLFQPAWHVQTVCWCLHDAWTDRAGRSCCCAYRGNAKSSTRGHPLVVGLSALWPHRTCPCGAPAPSPPQRTGRSRPFCCCCCWCCLAGLLVFSRCAAAAVEVLRVPRNSTGGLMLRRLACSKQTS